MRKRVLPLALALALCLGLCVVPAGAYDMGKVGEYSIISCGSSHTAAIDENGSLWMWGDNGLGQLGNGGVGNATDRVDRTTPLQTVPVKVMDNVAAVSCGYAHTAAIKTDGTLWMWGSNLDGQLGNGGGSNKVVNGYRIQTVPVKVMDNVAAVNCGGWHTAAIKTDGTLWMWGNNGNGQLGNGTSESSDVPVKVMDNVAAVSCGNYQTAAIKTDGTLWMWGSNFHRELGSNGSLDGSQVPAKVMDNVAAVSCGYHHTAAIKTDGTLWTWGMNYLCQLGNGGAANAKGLYETPCQTIPVKVLDNVASVSCGGAHTAAVKLDGTLWTWGNNVDGQLGNGGAWNTTVKGYGAGIQNVPVQVLDNVAAVSCGYNHTVAAKADGTLWTWGSNEDGKLGNGGRGNDAKNSYIYQTVPLQIKLGKEVSLPWGIRLNLNGGTGGSNLWTAPGGSITVPTNPTKEGYTFGGWYTDPGFTTPWNFNDKVVNTLTLYAKWVPVSSKATTTGKSSQTITLNGNAITLDAYTLKADNGGDVTYVKLRDIAALLDGTSAQFNVDWRSGAIYVDSGKAYTTRNGTELKAISGANGSYRWNTSPVLFNGATKALEGIVITDGQGGGHTFFKLRDLGAAIGFTVDWTWERGIFIETE